MRWVAVAAVLLLAFPVSGQEARGPISIYADEDWLSPASGRRSGSGTEADPYIVSGWRIERPVVDIRQSDAAIHIENSQAHVVLRDLVIEQRFEKGLEVFDASNIRIEGATIRGQRLGMSLHDSRDILLQDMVIRQSGPSEVVSGLWLQDVQGVTLRRVTITDGQGLGLLIGRAQGVTLEAVQVARQDGGMVVVSSKDVILRGVAASANRGDGIVVSNVTAVDARDITATDQVLPQGLQTGRGLLVWRSSGLLQGVHAARNAGDGARMWDGAAELRDSHFVDNGGHGLVVAQSDARLVAIEAHGNDGHGVMLFAPAAGVPHARVLALQTHDNDDAGLFVQGLAGLHLDVVRSEHNGGAGIDLRDTRNTTVLHAIAAHNDGAGVLLVQVTGGQLVENQARSNQGHGFSLRGTSGLVLRNNTASGNMGSGFFLDGGGLVLRGNTAAGNQGLGIDVQLAAQDAVLEGNTLVGNRFGNQPAPAPGRDTPAPFAVVWLAFALVARRLSARDP